MMHEERGKFLAEAIAGLVEGAYPGEGRDKMAADIITTELKMTAAQARREAFREAALVAMKKRSQYHPTCFTYDWIKACDEIADDLRAKVEEAQ
jgi:hypothetical protein